MRFLLLASLLLSLALSGCDSSHASSPPASSYPMTETEVQALNGAAEPFNRSGLYPTDKGWQLAPEGEIARIASGNESVARSIASMVIGARAFGRSEFRIAQEASRAHGVALVQSGATWVPAR